MKKFKHVKLGYIAEIDPGDTVQGHLACILDPMGDGNNLIPVDIVENSSDWEEVGIDWIDKMCETFSYGDAISHDNLREMINEHMPKITEKMLEHMEYEPNINVWREYLKEKGLYKEDNKDE